MLKDIKKNKATEEILKDIKNNKAAEKIQNFVKNVNAKKEAKSEAKNFIPKNVINDIINKVEKENDEVPEIKNPLNDKSLPEKKQRGRPKTNYTPEELKKRLENRRLADKIRKQNKRKETLEGIEYKK